MEARTGVGIVGLPIVSIRETNDIQIQRDTLFPVVLSRLLSLFQNVGALDDTTSFERNINGPTFLGHRSPHGSKGRPDCHCGYANWTSPTYSNWTPSPERNYDPLRSPSLQTPNRNPYGEPSHSRRPPPTQLQSYAQSSSST